MALQRGDGEGTLAALGKHEKLFANGHFAEEREALSVHALSSSPRRRRRASAHDSPATSVERAPPRHRRALGTIP